MLSLASPPAGAAVDGSSDRSARDRRLHTRQIPLLRLAGFQSIRTGMQAVMHDITTLLGMALRQPETDSG